MNARECSTCERTYVDPDNTAVCPHGHEPEPDAEERDYLTGENPGLDALAAVRRGGVVGVLSAADQITATADLARRQADVLNELRELHMPGTVLGSGERLQVCEHCVTVTGRPVLWPCDTGRILERVPL